MEKEILEEVLHRFNGKSSAGLQHACETYVATGEEPNGLGCHAGGVWLLLKELMDEEKQNEVLQKELSAWKLGKKKVIRVEQAAESEEKEKDESEEHSSDLRSITTVVQDEKEPQNREEFSNENEKTTSSSDDDDFNYENLKSEKARCILTMPYGKLLKCVPKEIWKEVPENELGTMGEVGLRRKMVEYWELQERLDNEILKYFNDHIPKGLRHKIHQVHAIRGIRLKNVMHVLSSIGVKRTHILIDMFFHSNFLMGINPYGWVADFQWLFHGENYDKVLDERYDKRSQNTEREYVHRRAEGDKKQHFEENMESAKKRTKRSRRSALMEENKRLRDALREERRKNAILEHQEGIKREVDGMPEWMQKARGVHRRLVFNENKPDEDYAEERSEEEDEQVPTPEGSEDVVKEKKEKEEKLPF